MLIDNVTYFVTLAYCPCRRFVRNQMVLANTLFRTVCYHPEEHQIITSGTDRKVDCTHMYANVPFSIVYSVYQ